MSSEASTSNSARPRRKGSLSRHLVVRLAESPAGLLLGRSLILLRYTAQDGRVIVLPVQAVRSGTLAAVLVGNADRKKWWRHFISPSPVDIHLDGRWQPATGLVVGPDSEAGDLYPATRQDATLVAISLGTPPAPVRGRELRRLWFWTVTLAEFCGFVTPALVGVSTAHLPTAFSLPSLLVAGGVEGAMLGFGQAAVLRLALPELPVRRWIIATACAASFAYLLGLTPSLIAGSASHWPPALLAVGGCVAGLMLLGSIGTAQWWILRRHVDRAESWIVTTAGAWLVGLAVFLAFAMPLWRPGQPVILLAVIGIAGGLLMAATTAALTGIAVRRLARPRLLSKGAEGPARSGPTPAVDTPVPPAR